jgi:hypothetical protein
MAEPTVTFDDVHVVTASDLAMTVRVQRKVVVVGNAQPLAGTTVRWLGDRGRLVLPRWAARELGLWEPTEQPRRGLVSTR